MWRNVFALLVVPLLVGCGDGIPVSGSVMLDGEPLSAGVIKFVPTVGVDAPTAATQITSGQYAFGSADGPLPGQYTVEIYKDDPVPTGLDDPQEFVKQKGQLKTPKNTVAARFNKDSILKVEISADGERRLDYEVTSR